MEILFTDEAIESLKYYKKKDSRVFDRIKDMFTTMRKMKDPRILKNIEPMRGNMKNSYRAAIYQPLSIRILFIITDSNGVLVQAAEPICSGNEYEITVFRVDNRRDVYSQPEAKNAMKKARELQKVQRR